MFDELMNSCANCRYKLYNMTSYGKMSSKKITPCDNCIYWLEDGSGKEFRNWKPSLKNVECKSRNGVFYNLHESDYRYVTSIYTLIFSSKFHMEKFVKIHDKFHDKLSEAISNRYNVKFSSHILSDILCYKKIETRGFLILINGLPCTSLNDIEISNGSISRRV